MSIPVSSFTSRLVDTSADASFDKKGKAVSHGGRINRLKLGTDSRFYIAATKSHWWDLRAQLGKAFGYSVEVKDKDGSSILLNINSMATRLHMSQESIQQAAKAGNLLELVDQKAREAEKVVSQYEKIIGQYDLKKEELVGKKEGVKTGLTPAILMKVIRAALRTNLDPKKTTQEKKIQVKERTFFARYNAKGVLKLTQISKRLGKGTYGEAILVTELNKGKEKVFKRAHAQKATMEEAEVDIQNEFAKLTQIHAEGNVWGIQAKPKRMVLIAAVDNLIGKREFGFIGEKYDGDYFSDIKKNQSIPIKDRLFEFHQLLYGLKHLHEKGILHSDLKPENVLVKIFNGYKLVHIADFGGACDSNGLPLEKLIEFSYTADYFPTEDEDAIIDEVGAWMSWNKEAKVIEIQKKHDVFSMGMILYEALSKGRSPYLLDNDRRPIIQKYRELDSSVPKEARELIKEMLQADYHQRPTAEQAFERLESLIQMKHSDLYRRIQSLKAKQ